MKKLISILSLVLICTISYAQTGAYWRNTYGTSIYLKEQTTAKEDLSDFGQLWIRTASPNQLWFTNDTGQDMLLGDHSFGAIYFSSATATSVATINVPIKAAGTTTAIDTTNFSINLLSNRLKYTGTKPRIFTATFTGSTTGESNTKLITMSIAKNGTVITSSKVSRTIATAANYTEISLQAVVSLTTNDYVEVFITNETDATDVTIQQGVLTVK